MTDLSPETRTNAEFADLLVKAYRASHPDPDSHAELTRRFNNFPTTETAGGLTELFKRFTPDSLHPDATLYPLNHRAIVEDLVEALGDPKDGKAEELLRAIVTDERNIERMSRSMAGAMAAYVAIAIDDRYENSDLTDRILAAAQDAGNTGIFHTISSIRGQHRVHREMRAQGY